LGAGGGLVGCGMGWSGVEGRVPLTRPPSTPLRARLPRADFLMMGMVVVVVVGVKMGE
jgi:hypothetical protein